MLLFAAVAVAAVAAVAAELCAAAGAAAVAGGAAAAAHAGDGAACAKSHDLTAGLQSINSLVATQRKLHPADSIADFPKVAFGSKATDTDYLRRVRFTPGSDRRADISDGQLRANRGLTTHSKRPVAANSVAAMLCLAALKTQGNSDGISTGLRQRHSIFRMPSFSDGLGRARRTPPSEGYAPPLQGAWQPFGLGSDDP